MFNYVKRFVKAVKLFWYGDPKQTRSAGFNCRTTGDPMFYDKYDCIYCGAPGYSCEPQTSDEETS